MKLWECKECGHTVLAELDDRYYCIYWSDGHICENWKEVEIEEPLENDTGY